MHVQIDGIDKWFGANHVLRRCDLSVEQGELITLLGPSGCGKTTLLRCLAGFELPDGGSVSIGEDNVTHLAPNHRNVGFVFQSYALFPHLTVVENVGYGLAVRRVSKAKRVRRAMETLELVGLQQFGDRYPARLSGGQQQRVALARALVLQPKVLLLDEAFNALDAKLRVAMQVELRKLVKKVGITTICVTHDQTEALTISDRIAVMFEGRIDQMGTPSEVYERPCTAFVADFLGTANLLRRRSEGGSLEVGPGIRISSTFDGGVIVVVRPEDVMLSQPIEGDGWGGRITFSRLVGPSIEFEIDTGEDRPVRVLSPRRGGDRYSVGDRVALALSSRDACVVLPHQEAS